MRHPSLRWLWITAVASSVPAAAQTIPEPADHEMQPIWGGQNQVVHLSETEEGRRLLVGCGGGLIRRSIDGGAIEYVDTPDDFTGTVIDIEFVDEDLGYACGRNGQVLQTDNGGATWTKFGVPIGDPCSTAPGENLATCWALHPFNDQVVIVVGLWTARYTEDGGNTWHKLKLYDLGGTFVSESEFHFYAIDVAGDLGGWRGALAAEWEVKPGDRRGVVFHTDSLDPSSDSGRTWLMTLDDSLTDTSCTMAKADPKMTEPWALEFERGAGSSPPTATGYVVGGIGDNRAGRIWRTDDGGATWTFETNTPETPYTVTVEPGRVLVGSYSGRTYFKNGSTWSFDFDGCLGCFSGSPNPVDCPTSLPGPPLPPGFAPLMNETTVAMHSVDSSDDLTFCVAGGWGLTMLTEDAGATWQNVNPHQADITVGPNLVPDIVEARLHAIDALPNAPATLHVAGQLGLYARSSDAGATFDWSVLPNSGTLRSLRFWDSNRGVAVGDRATLRWTNDGGTTWNKGLLDDPYNLITNQVDGDSNQLEFLDVDVRGSNEAWAVGAFVPGGTDAAAAYTDDGGANWTLVLLPTFPNLRLTGVLQPEALAGLFVGWATSAQGDRAKAFVTSFDPITHIVTWAEVSPPHQVTPNPSGNPPSRKLLGIDGHGTSLANTTAYAVGNGGMVLAWNGASSTFVDVPAVYDLVDTGPNAGDVQFRELKTDLNAIGVSPSGNRVLIGTQYDIDLRHTSDLGWMLELDGTWSRTRAHSGKSLLRAVLTSDDDGYVLGHSTATLETGFGTRKAHCDGYTSEDVVSHGFDNPNLKDTVILRYESE